MKILITLDEVRSIVYKHFNLNPTVAEIVFSDLPVDIAALHPLRAEFIAKLTKVELDINRGNKIGAIKEYRTLSGCGLKEAKDVIESWEKAKQAMLKTNRFVIPKYSDITGYILDWIAL
jgi:ribosomal protein L7/L12